MSNKTNTQILGNHHHGGRMLLPTEIMVKKLSMTGKHELFRLDIAHIDRRRHDGIDEVVLQITTGSVQRTLRHLSGNFCGSAQIQLHLLFIQIDEIRPFCRKLLGRFSELEGNIRPFHIFFVAVFRFTSEAWQVFKYNCVSSLENFIKLLKLRTIRKILCRFFVCKINEIFYVVVWSVFF